VARDVYGSGQRRDRPSLPTRRSSDLATSKARPTACTSFAPCSVCRRWFRRRSELWIQRSRPTTPSPPPSRHSATVWTSTRTATRSEEHTSELQSRENLVCRLLLEKKN